MSLLSQQSCLGAASLQTLTLCLQGMHQSHDPIGRLYPVNLF